SISWRILSRTIAMRSSTSGRERVLPSFIMRLLMPCGAGFEFRRAASRIYHAMRGMRKAGALPPFVTPRKRVGEGRRAVAFHAHHHGIEHPVEPFEPGMDVVGEAGHAAAGLRLEMVDHVQKDLLLHTRGIAA